MLLDFLFVFGLVGRDERDLLPVRAPRELFDAVGHVREAVRFAAGHRQDEKLELRIFRGGVYSFEGEAVAFRRPARRAHAFAIVRKSARRAACDVDDEQVAVSAILIEIDARAHEGNRFSVGRNLWIRDGRNFGEVVEFDGARGRNCLRLSLLRRGLLLRLRLRGGGRLARCLRGEARRDDKQKCCDDQREKRSARDAGTCSSPRLHPRANFSGCERRLIAGGVHRWELLRRGAMRVQPLLWRKFGEGMLTRR